MGHNDQRVLAAHAALEHCVKQCSERAWRLAYGMMRNSADAADVVQQAFLVAALKPSKIPANDPWPWFGTVVAYTAKNARRKRSRTASEEQAMNVQDGCASDPHSSLECSEEYAALHEALDALDEDERDAVVLTQMSSLPYRDAAKALGVPLGTFNHRVGRGLANLRQRFGVDNTNISRQLTVLPIVAPPGGFDVMAQTWLGMAKTAVSAGASVSGTVIAGGLIMGNKLVAAGLVAAGVIAGFGGSVAYLEMAEKNDRLASSTEATGRADAPRADSATVKENGQNEATVLRKERDNLATLLAAEKERSAEFERRLSTHPQGIAKPDNADDAETIGAQEPSSKRANASMDKDPVAFANWKYAGLENVNWRAAAKNKVETAELMLKLVEAHEKGIEPDDQSMGKLVSLMTSDTMFWEQFEGKLPSNLGSADSVTSHPYVMANMVANILNTAGVPLTESQRVDIENRGMQFDRDRESAQFGYNDSTLKLEKIIDERELETAFWGDVKSMLTPEQKTALYKDFNPEAEEASLVGSYDTINILHIDYVSSHHQNQLRSELERKISRDWGLASIKPEVFSHILDDWFHTLEPATKVIRLDSKGSATVGSLSLDRDEYSTLARKQLAVMKLFMNLPDLTNAQRDLIRNTAKVTVLMFKDFPDTHSFGRNK